MLRKRNEGWPKPKPGKVFTMPEKGKRLLEKKRQGEEARSEKKGKVGSRKEKIIWF